MNSRLMNHEIRIHEFMKNHEDSVLLYTERYALVTIDPHDNESKQRMNE